MSLHRIVDSSQMYSAQTRAAWTRGWVSHSAALALALFSFAGCGSSSKQVTAPTSLTRCAVNLAVEPGTVSATGGVGTINVGVNRECGWEAQAGAEWVVLTSARSGQGDATLSYTVGPNPQVTARRAVISVNDSRVDVTQAAAACVYTLGSQGRAFDAGGGSDRVEVRTQAGCAWTAQSGAPWILVVPAGSGSGDGVVTLSVAPNEGSTRAGTVTIAAQTYRVTQDAPAATPSPTPTPPPGSGPTPAPAPPGPAPPTPGPSPTPTPTPAPEPPPTPAPTPDPPPTPAPAPEPEPTPTPTPGPPSCNYAVAPPSQAVPPDGGPGRVTVGTAGGCTWTATTTAAWLMLTGAASGSGNGAVTFQAAPNPDAVSRSATVTVGGQTATVTQPASTSAPTPCTFRVSQTTVTAAAEATTTTIGVTASAPTCAWATTGGTSWLAIAPPAGTGSASVRLALTANTATTSRSATVTIAGTSVTVAQAAAPPPATPTCTYALVPSSRTLGAADVATSTRLETQPGCAWTAVSAEPWLVVTTPSGTGSSTIALTVVPNTTPNRRTGAVTIGRQTLSITQEGLAAVVEETRLDGIISQVSGACPTVSFRVDDRVVRTTAATMFVADSCARLRNGEDVEARGYAQTNGDILATRVRVKGGNGGN